jgi:hypothetical protein
MREPPPGTPLFGLLAEFDEASKLMAGVRAARDKGYGRMDAYSPYPVEGLAEIMGMRDRRVPLLCLAGGALGAATGLGMQFYTNAAYPIDIGGRPLFALPAFMLITFELAVLGAVGFAILGMLVLNHLPRLHHPVFDVDDFRLASDDRFFLVIFSDDPRFDLRRTRGFLRGLQPVRVERVGHTEEPE